MFPFRIYIIGVQKYDLNSAYFNIQARLVKNDQASTPIGEVSFQVEEKDSLKYLELVGKSSSPVTPSFGK